ncbi:B1 bradykinin receptor-like, partial [Brachionus plicatilis]
MKNVDKLNELQKDEISSTQEYFQMTKTNYLLIFYELSKWSNVVFITLITLFGIYGNLISIKIFTSPSYKNVKPLKYYLILLSVSDLSVLVTHYIDFTFRSWVNLLAIYSTKFNFVDKFNFFCKLVPYLRNVFKTLSVYLLLIMTLHRFILLYFPMTKSRLNSAKFNKKLLFFLLITSLLVNFGILFFNSIAVHQVNGEHFCTIQPKYIKINLYSEIFFILFTILIPSIFFLLFSLVLLKKIIRLDKKNDFFLGKNHAIQTNVYSMITFNENVNYSHSKSNQTLCVVKNIEPVFGSKVKKNGFSVRTTYMMVLLSKWFVLLHFPYFLTWLVFYSHLNYSSGENFKSVNTSDTNFGATFADRT